MTDRIRLARELLQALGVRPEDLLEPVEPPAPKVCPDVKADVERILGRIARIRGCAK